MRSSQVWWVGCGPLERRVTEGPLVPAAPEGCIHTYHSCGEYAGTFPTLDCCGVEKASGLRPQKSWINFLSHPYGLTAPPRLKGPVLGH